MHFFKPLALLSLPLASAAVVLPRAPKEYYLKTANSPTDKFNGLYVEAYHTGAGFNDATLGDKSTAAKGYLNGTAQLFDLGTEFPWGMVLTGGTSYQSWGAVQINAGATSQSGYAINGTGLQGPAAYGFGGWLACDWWHDVPQLFYFYSYLKSPPSSNCAAVDLQVEYI